MLLFDVVESLTFDIHVWTAIQASLILLIHVGGLLTFDIWTKIEGIFDTVNTAVLYFTLLVLSIFSVLPLVERGDQVTERGGSAERIAPGS